VRRAKTMIVKLVFPPATEAALFPYLSLPVLAASLDSHGVGSQQYDVNLWLLKRLTEQDSLEKLHVAIDNSSRTRSSKIVRHAILAYLERFPQTWCDATRKDRGAEFDVVKGRAVRMIKRALDIAVETSAVISRSPDFHETVRQLNPGTICTDIFGSLFQEWVRSNISPEEKLVGISVPFFSQILPSLVLAKLIKDTAQGALIVLGGPQVWLHFCELAKSATFYGGVDALCFGPGETTIVELALREPSPRRDSIPNLRWLINVPHELNRPSFKDQEFPILQQQPTPRFDRNTLSGYFSQDVQFPLITCLGCYWGRCTFCSYGKRYHETGAYQEMTEDRLAWHCIELVRQYGATRVNFVDENTNVKLVVRAMRIVQQRGFTLNFSVRNRLDAALLNLEFCKELKELGCVLMSAGYETNSQRLLDLLKRGLKAEHLQQIIDNLHVAGINLRISIMGGILDETCEEMLTSFEFLKYNAHKLGIDTMQKLIAEPMTPLTIEPGANGITTLAGPQTDWNRMMNFGLGRVGHSFAVSKQLPDIEASFAALFRTIEPLGNDESPSKSVAGHRLTSQRVETISLPPWAIAIDLDEKYVSVCDLSWQSYYKLNRSEFDLVSERKLRLRDGAGSVRSAAQLIRLGLASAE
jgi:anaerobic magnesium-protoporphyrin IX monomethyl ester cyclase